MNPAVVGDDDLLHQREAEPAARRDTGESSKDYAIAGSDEARTRREAGAILVARAQGYTGEMCSCGSSRVKRNGACTVCEDCGTTSGCS